MLPNFRTLYKYIILCLSFRCLLPYLTFPLLPISVIAWRWIWICLNFIESDHLTQSDCTIDYRRVDLQINMILGCCLVRSTEDLDANYTHSPPFIFDHFRLWFCWFAFSGVVVEKIRVANVPPPSLSWIEVATFLLDLRPLFTYEQVIPERWPVRMMTTGVNFHGFAHRNPKSRFQ